VLDVGCGTGIFYKYLKTRAHKSWDTSNYHGVDISSQMIKICQNNYKNGPKFSCVPFLDFTVPNTENLFSCVIFNECFHYMDDQAAAFQKAVECTAKNGIIVISHPKGYDNVVLQNSKNLMLVPGLLPVHEDLQKLCDSCADKDHSFSIVVPPNVSEQSYLAIVQKL